MSQLLYQNSTNSIIINHFYQEIEHYAYLMIATIDISKLNLNDNSTLVATIVNYNNMEFYKPIEFTIQKLNPIEFKFEEEVEFDNKNRTFFKFEYKHISDKPQEIIFYFDYLYYFSLFFTDDTKTKKLDFENDYSKVNLTRSGLYYIEFDWDENYPLLQNIRFRTFIHEELVDTIDLSQKMYYRSSTLKTKTKFGPNKYKVKNLKKDIHVFFTYNIKNEDDTILFYNPFEICIDNKNECIRNITTFKFIKGNEYTIYIHFIEKLEKDIHDKYIYYYPSYAFFPIFDDTIEEKEEGFYYILDPKIFIVNLTKKDDLFLYHENANKVYKTYTNELDVLNDLNNLDYNISSKIDVISEKEGYANGIIVIIP